MYAKGEGVDQNDAEALKWLRLAALQGHPDALKWYQKTADEGNAIAQYNLGLMYAKGEGVDQNDAEALKWFRLAAEQGSAVAQYNLGIMYRDGRGIPQDYVQAYVWFSLAASRFPASEKESRDLAVKDRDRVASRMAPVQIAEAQRLTRTQPVEINGVVTLDFTVDRYAARCRSTLT